MALSHFLQHHWSSWSTTKGYLGLRPHYATTCPPLMFIAGNPIPKTKPLIVVSLEPLQASHFRKQIAFATGSFANYCSWQLDYFKTFPSLAGVKPQPYWSTMHSVVRGWAGAPSSTFDWKRFGDHFIELPFVPLHAPRTNPGAYKAAIGSLNKLLHERLELITTQTGRAGVLLLGAPLCRHVLPLLSTGVGRAVSMPSHVASAMHGYTVLEHTPKGRWGSNVRLFARSAPFSRHFRPTNDALTDLGSALRTLV